MLTRLFKPRPAYDAGQRLFAAAAAQARTPAFYVEAGAADTIDGRFEMYLIHVVLLVLRLRGHGDRAQETNQILFDAFLQNLDDAMREMGVGDLSVGKKMRKLGEAFYGRAKAYDEALAARPDGEPLRALVARTLYADDPAAADAHAGAFAGYVARAADHLAAQPLDRLLAGEATFPELHP